VLHYSSFDVRPADINPGRKGPAAAPASAGAASGAPAEESWGGAPPPGANDWPGRKPAPARGGLMSGSFGPGPAGPVPAFSGARFMAAGGLSSSGGGLGLPPGAPGGAADSPLDDILSTVSSLLQDFDRMFSSGGSVHAAAKGAR
jgi:hypothetical protein